MTTIPGYDAVLELGATPDDVSAVGQAISVREQKGEKGRSVFGTAFAGRAGGLKSLEFTFEGLCDDAEYATIRGHFAASAAVAFGLELGDNTGTSAGTYAGSGEIYDLSADANPDGDWTFRLTFRSTGSYTYT